MEERNILTTGTLCILCLLAALAYPLWRRQIAPNRWYGFRTTKTLSNPKIWYQTNEKGGKVLFISSLVTGFMALALHHLLSHMDIVSYCAVLATLISVPPVVATIWALVFT